jgi:vitamin K-dependent gamma-carboxylase
LLSVLPSGSGWIPVWAVWLLRFQLTVVYCFAGIAKLNGDWLLAAQPMRIWLTARSDLPLIGAWLAKPWVAFAASWSGMLYDLTIPVWLLWARSRPWAYAAVVVFHLATLVLFRIGMFPWIMLVATLIFFPPDWPRKWLGNWRLPQTTTSSHQLTAWSLLLVCAYVLVQFALPLRALWQPQQGAWDGRGFNFSWRVMLVEKTGYVEFFAFNPATRQRERLSVSALITPRQRVFMAQDPGLIRQLAVRLGEDLRAAGKEDWEVRTDAWATLNGRPSQRLIRPDVNLAGPLPSDWIVPLNLN